MRRWLRERREVVGAWLRPRSKVIFRSSLYPALPILLAVVTGLLGSLYANEIRQAPPFTWLSGAGVSKLWAIAGFWFLLIAAALTYYPRQQALDEERREEAREFIRRLSALPPADFLAVFGDVFTTSYSALLNAQANRNRTECELAIRQVLKSIAVLAHTFDSAVSTVRYAANIMTFSRIEGMNEQARVKMRNEIRFSGGAGLETLQGVLLTNSALSATTLSDGPDSQLGQFSLPVPKEHERMIGGRPRYLVLPGAPHAFVTGESSRFADTSGLADWCRDQGDFPQRVIEEIEDYFASDSGGSIRSFISLPLKKGGQCYAIVNIHRNTTGILLEQELVGRFVAILRPFELLLIALLDLLATMEDQ